MPTKAQLVKELETQKSLNKLYSKKNKSLSQSVSDLNKKIQSLKDSKDEVVKRNLLLNTDIRTSVILRKEYNKMVDNIACFTELSWFKRATMSKASVKECLK